MFDATRARMLEAMGYQLLVRAGRVPVRSPDASAASTASTSASAEAPPAAAPLPASVVSDNRLWNAVLAAAALDPSRAEANGLRLSVSGVAVEYVRDELWIDPVALRRDRRAKAKLWKTLRTLRRRELARRS